MLVNVAGAPTAGRVSPAKEGDSIPFQRLRILAHDFDLGGRNPDSLGFPPYRVRHAIPEIRRAVENDGLRFASALWPEARE
jgi:hypothetical protein